MYAYMDAHENASGFLEGFGAKRFGSVVYPASSLRRFIPAAGPYGDRWTGSKSTW